MCSDLFLRIVSLHCVHTFKRQLYQVMHQLRKLEKMGEGGKMHLKYSRGGNYSLGSFFEFFLVRLLSFFEQI